MIDFDGPRERAPSKLERLRIGVVYSADLDFVLPILRRATVKLAMAAVGPKLFWGRADGPWVDYDAGLVDQNAGKPVRARAWPWCAGDELWIVAVWDNLPIIVHMISDDEVELVLDLAVHVDQKVSELARLARRMANVRTHRRAKQVRLPPPPQA